MHHPFLLRMVYFFVALKNRIFDYLNGVSYIIGAHVKKVSDNLLMYAPEHVEVDKEVAPKRSGVRSWLS